LDHELDECSFCGRIFEPSGFETFTFISSDPTPEKHVYRVPVTDAVYACVDFVDGRRFICEQCYEAAAYGQRSEEELASIHTAMAGEYLCADRFDDAERCGKLALRLDHSNDTLATVATMYDGLGHLGKATAHLERLRDIGPDHQRVITCLPTLYLKAGRLTDALEQVSGNRENRHYGYDLVMDAAEALWRLGRQDEAAEAYDAALEWSNRCCSQCADLIRERWTEIRAGRYSDTNTSPGEQPSG